MRAGLENVEPHENLTCSESNNLKKMTQGAWWSVVPTTLSGCHMARALSSRPLYSIYTVRRLGGRGEVYQTSSVAPVLEHGGSNVEDTRSTGWLEFPMGRCTRQAGERLRTFSLARPLDWGSDPRLSGNKSTAGVGIDRSRRRARPLGELPGDAPHRPRRASSIWM